MPTTDPASTATAFLQAFGNGNLDATLALLDDDVDFDVPGSPTVPWTGRRQGHRGAAEFFALLGEHLEPEMFEVDKILADRETAVVLGRFKQRVKRTDDSFSSEFALRLQVGGGRITRYLMLENSWTVANVFDPSVSAAS